jgi:nitrate/TMAO reductase-like tetraheme cytochrome c subunit
MALGSNKENPGSLWRKPESRLLLGVPIGGLLMFVLGVIALGGFNWAMEVTGETQFCLSCHEMEAFVYPEYQASIHYSNPAGVRAECVDCHLPSHSWFAKTAAKIYVSKDLYFHLTGKINTREKYEAHRLEMAQREWSRLEANDSRECRGCHSFEAMDSEAQPRFASRQHAAAMSDGGTCIDCHRGVAHALPAASAVSGTP